MSRLVIVLAVGFVVSSSALKAQEDVPRPDTTLLDIQTKKRKLPESNRLAVFPTKHLPAAEAARLVEDVLGDDVRVILDPVGNRLLIRASDAKLKEAKNILDVLDQPPKMIAFDVTFADLPATAGDAKEGKTSDEAWLARLKKQKDKTEGNIKTVRLTATDNQEAMVQFGEQTPVVTGVSQKFAGRGRAGVARTPIVQQTQLGTIVKCTARVSDDQTIIAEFEIERSRLAPLKDATLLEETDDDGAVRAPGLLTTTCQTTLTLKPGKPQVLSGHKTQNQGRGVQSLIVITVELIPTE